jgi:hypothetical protein
MITLQDYFGDKPHPTEYNLNALTLLYRVNDLLSAYFTDTGTVPQKNPITGTQISGSKSGDGGFRLPTSSTGTANSAHRFAQAVDIYDPGEQHLDKWIDANPDSLIKYNLYREDPGATINWCHLGTRKPLSGKRTFKP